VIIPKHRKQFDASQARLRRGRRLYVRLVRGELIRNPESVFIFSQRAISRGLYAPSCTLKDGAFSLLRAAYKQDQERMSWSQWLHFHNIGYIWWQMGRHKRLKMGKPVLRLIA